MADAALEEIDLDYATTLADCTNRHMAQHGVAPTPNNFAVWFNCVRGTLPELERSIDILVAGEKRFDSASSRQLFLTYMVPDSARMSAGDIPEQLRSVLTEAKRFVAVAIADNRTQIRAIGDVAEQTGNSFDPRSLVECLMEELTKAKTRASELVTNLSETSRELDTIGDEFLLTSQISALETGEPFSILLIDIDRFKQFNDNFGHAVGDQVLRLMANALRERVREQDMPARDGGEELIAVLPGADLTVCEAVAERIR